MRPPIGSQADRDVRIIALTKEELRKVGSYRRAANYLSVGQDSTSPGTGRTCRRSVIGGGRADFRTLGVFDPQHLLDLNTRRGIK